MCLHLGLCLLIIDIPRFMYAVIDIPRFMSAVIDIPRFMSAYH